MLLSRSGTHLHAENDSNSYENNNKDTEKYEDPYNNLVLVCVRSLFCHLSEGNHMGRFGCADRILSLDEGFRFNSVGLVDHRHLDLLGSIEI